MGRYQNKKIQVKDITDEEVFRTYTRLVTENLGEPVQHVDDALCEIYPWKIVARKLDSMEDRGKFEYRGGFGPLYGFIIYKEEKANGN